MYTTFWLAVGLSVFQVILGLVFLIWFVITLLVPVKSASGQQRLSWPPNTSGGTPRTVVEALGEPRGAASHATRARQAYSMSPRTHSASLSSLRSRSRCSCHPKVGWLCLAGIFLALLSAGLTLSLVIVVNYVKYLDTSFIPEFTNVFIEAHVDFNSQTSDSPKHSLVCWNIVQSHYRCCGLTNYTDWFSGSSNLTSPGQTQLLLPDSCYCKSECDYHKVKPIGDGTHLVYTVGCNPRVHEAFHFKLHSSLLYFALTLGLLLTAFLVDLVYTLYTAYVTLSLTHRVRGADDVSAAVFDLQPLPSSSSLEPTSHSANVSIVNGNTGREF
ncbi:unnamed protein product [Echinostoma caproni]|uniref:Tetraspanin n=1 Tax=Echinostoma caproni TaxID=27848 RepID=A0A183A585_9TREM|nr:unnamed protein product [Echinostoma caproni]